MSDPSMSAPCMHDYALGASLRRQLLADQQRGIHQDPRRLQALAGDFCGDQQLALLPALKYLLLTPAFGQALAHRPALPPDPHLALQLQQDLEAVFAPAISSRTGAVLRGLLDLPAQPTAPPLSWSPPPPAATVAPPPPVASAGLGTSPPPPRSGSRGVVALLSFMAGVLVVGVLGVLTWLLQLNNRPAGLPTPPLPSSELPPAQLPSQPAPADQVTTPPPPPNLEQAELERAISSVQQLYSALSSGNIAAARSLFGGAAADQFDPSFFRQFSAVSVADLVETGRNGSTVDLTGLVTFSYPDGTSQVESRSFRVDTATDPALITASSFLAVVQPR